MKNKLILLCLLLPLSMWAQSVPITTIPNAKDSGSVKYITYADALKQIEGSFLIGGEKVFYDSTFVLHIAKLIKERYTYMSFEEMQDLRIEWHSERCAGVLRKIDKSLLKTGDLYVRFFQSYFSLSDLQNNVRYDIFNNCLNGEFRKVNLYFYKNDFLVQTIDFHEVGIK